MSDLERRLFVDKEDKGRDRIGFRKSFKKKKTKWKQEMKLRSKLPKFLGGVTFNSGGENQPASRWE